MKTFILFALQFLCIALCRSQTIYYYDGSGPLSTTTNWWTNRAGTGSSPANFTTASQHFYIQTGQTVTNSASWSISGTSTRLLIENTASLTASTSISLSANTTFRIDDGGTYVHNNTNTSAILGGTESFGATSTFRINSWSTGTPVTSNITASATGFDGNSYYFGHLEMNWAAGATWQQSWATTTFYLTAGNLTFTNIFTGTFRFNSSSGGSTSPDVYVAGNFNWNSAGTLDFTAKNAPAYLNVNGNITQTAGTLTVSGSGPSGSIGYIYTYGNGSSNWTFSGGTRDLVGYRIALQGAATAKTVNLLSNFNMATGASGWLLSNMLNVSAGCTLDAGTYIMSISAGSTQVSTFGTIRTSNVNGLTGSASTTLSNSPLVQWGVGTGCLAEYYATGAQTVSAVPIYENLRIMNTGTKTLAGNANVFKNYYFNASGDYLDVGNNTLTIESAGTINGAGSTSYFITGAGTTAGGGGRLRQNSFSSSRLFPVGNSSYYFPVTLTPASSGSFSVNAFSTTGMDGIVQSSSVKGWPEKIYIADAMWNINGITGGIAATARFDWTSNAIEGAVFNSRPDNELAIWRRTTDTIWVPAATGFSPNSNTSNYATAVNISAADFNTQFVAAWMQQILPFKIISFTGRRAATASVLYWEIDSKEAIQNTLVERSADGNRFHTIGSVSNTSNNQYAFEDAGAGNQTWFYRLKVLMRDGTEQNSIIIKLMGEDISVKLLNTLVYTHLLLQQPATESAHCSVVNLSGQVLLNSEVSKKAIHYIDVAHLPPGQYVLLYQSSNVKKSFRFTKI
jgi:hypothetical protein